MSSFHREAAAIDPYLQYLDAQARGDHATGQRALQASADLGGPMALHAVAFQESRAEVANVLYRAAADAGYAPSAWTLYLHFDDAGGGKLPVLVKLWNPVAPAVFRLVAVSDDARLRSPEPQAQRQPPLCR